MSLFSCVVKSTIWKTKRGENQASSLSSSAKANQCSSQASKKMLAIAITLHSSPSVEPQYWVVPARYCSWKTQLFYKYAVSVCSALSAALICNWSKMTSISECAINNKAIPRSVLIVQSLHKPQCYMHSNYNAYIMYLLCLHGLIKQWNQGPTRNQCCGILHTPHHLCILYLYYIPV